MNALTRLSYLARVAHRRRQIDQGKPARHAGDPRTQEQRDLGIELLYKRRVALNVQRREERKREDAERRQRGREWLERMYRQKQEQQA